MQLDKSIELEDELGSGLHEGGEEAQHADIAGLLVVALAGCGFRAALRPALRAALLLPQLQPQLQHHAVPGPNNKIIVWEICAHNYSIAQFVSKRPKKQGFGSVFI